MGNIFSSIGNTISGLLGGVGATSQGQAQSGATSSATGVANTEANAFHQYFPSALNSYLQMSGFTPGQGFSPTFNPFALGTPTGNEMMNQFETEQAPAYNDAIANTEHQLIGEGYSGASSVSPSLIGQINTQKAANNANFAGNAAIQGANAGYQREAQAVGDLQGIGQGGAGINASLTSSSGGLTQATNQEQNSIDYLSQFLGMLGV